MLLDPDIDNEELEQLCRQAIKKGITRTALYFKLRAEGRKISDARLFKMWAYCGGPVRGNKRWF